MGEKLSSMKDQYNAAFSEMRKAVADSRNELLSKRSKKLLGTTHSHSHSFSHVHTLTKTYKKQMKVTKHLKHSVGKVKKNQAELRSKLKLSKQTKVDFWYKKYLKQDMGKLQKEVNKGKAQIHTKKKIKDWC